MGRHVDGRLIAEHLTVENIPDKNLALSSCLSEQQQQQQQQQQQSYRVYRPREIRVLNLEERSCSLDVEDKRCRERAALAGHKLWNVQEGNEPMTDEAR